MPTSDYDDETVKEKKNAEKFYTSDATAQRFFIAQQQQLALNKRTQFFIDEKLWFQHFVINTTYGLEILGVLSIL